MNRLVQTDMANVVKQGFQSVASRSPLRPGRDGWETGVLLAERWLATQERVDALLEQLTPGLVAQERARAQHLFYGVVRWFGRLDAGLAGLMARPPRTKVRALLLVTGFELLEQAAEAGAAGTGLVAKIIHHAVEKAKTVASVKEAGLVNAVARKLAGRLAEPVKTVAEAFSHPEWLVARWTRSFGAEATRALLEWNQRPAPVYARWRDAGRGVPDFLTPTRWAGFYEVKAGHWEDVRQLARDGALYLQDPSTRLSLELLAPRAGETVLDACAAPGGKSLMIADAMQTGRLVALDEPGPRLDRLRDNLARVPKGVEVALMPGDLGRAGPKYFEQFNLPPTYDAVLVDVPCSNTGVMRHRIDVKWRLLEGDIERHADQQAGLLRAAARMVRDGGRLVYSTCSIDAAENEDVVQRFLQSARGWKLARHVVATPWIDGHDGAGAFLLEKP